MKPPQVFETEKNMLPLIAAKYGRNEESLQEDVTCLKIWMKTQPHLPETLDDCSIKNFLILNKCSVEKAKRSIDMYYTLRTQIPDLYENINPGCPVMKKMMEILCFVPLPKLTKDMYRIMLWKVLDKKLIDKLEPIQALAMGWNVQELRLKKDYIYGDIVIFDMDGINFGYLTKLTPLLLVKGFAIYEKIYSIPLKNLYCVNSPPFINTFLTILKSLLKPKIFERVHVCEDTSILTKTFPREILPKDYGGLEKSAEELNELLKIKLNQYQDRFDQLDKLKVDENLRPEKLRNDEMLGFHGNFKKLNVD